MDAIRQKIGGFHDVHVETVTLDEPFITVAGRFSELPGTVVLLSGSDLDCARYNMLGVFPWMGLSGRDRNLTLRIGEAVYPVEEDPFLLVRYLLDCCRLPSLDMPIPVAAGLFGYFAYDLKDQLESLPRTSMDDLGLPHICLFSPAVLLIQDTINDTIRLCIPKREGMDISEFRNAFFGRLGAPLSETVPGGPSPWASGAGGSNASRDQHMAAVEAVREYIARGDVYQVNLSQRFEMDFSGNPWEFFRSLFERNPAPFFAYLQAGDHQIVSTSPERFIKQSGRRVETRPIKGTAPRGKTPEEDIALREKLVQSRKDDAELSMIVDLLRNDLGKACEGGSVRVAEHKRLEAYHNVYHLVSIVEGVLSSDRDSVDLLRAVFPGGSITGCPKIRSMEIIDELEPHQRHVYTGGIGYVSFHDTMDLSIAIRTATVVGGKILFSVGGGIVIDSDPADEYEETLHKGRTLMDLCGHGLEENTTRPVVWQNGRLIPADDASVPVSDLGVQYGFGFFETIRVDGGTVKHLPAHCRRFSETWERLFAGPAPDLSWPEIIGRVVSANGLGDRVAAVKILATSGSRTIPPYDHQVVVSARPYTHRLDDKSAPGLKLATYPEARQTPLADVKSTNYLYYYFAGNWARENGADEALILNPDGSISETNSANILLIKDETILLPDSAHVLPGTMQTAVLEMLSGSGFAARRESIPPEMLFRVDMVLLTNALMGVVPVIGLDGKDVRFNADLCRKINSLVLGN